MSGDGGYGKASRGRRHRTLAGRTPYARPPPPAQPAPAAGEEALPEILRAVEPVAQRQTLLGSLMSTRPFRLGASLITRVRVGRRSVRFITQSRCLLCAGHSPGHGCRSPPLRRCPSLAATLLRRRQRLNRHPCRQRQVGRLHQQADAILLRAGTHSHFGAAGSLAD